MTVRGEQISPGLERLRGDPVAVGRDRTTLAAQGRRDAAESIQ